VLTILWCDDRLEQEVGELLIAVGLTRWVGYLLMAMATFLFLFYMHLCIACVMCLQDLHAAKTILSFQKIDYDSDGDDTINWDGSSAAASKIGL